MRHLLASALALVLMHSVANSQAVLGGSNIPTQPNRPPAQSIGNESNWYIDWTSGNVFGPKTSGQWPQTPIATFNLGPGIYNLTGIIYGNGTSPATAITPGTGVATALQNAVNTKGGFPTIPVAAANVSSAAAAYNVAGSNLATTGTILAASQSLTVANARDFVVGQGIRVNHAGPAFTLNAPTGGTATPTGTVGSTTYQYEIAALDPNGGVSAAAGSFQTTTGNATLSATNFNYLTWTASSGTAPAGYAVYKSIGGVYTLIGITPDTTFYDYGFLSYTALDWVPATAPSAALADWLVTTISGQVGATFTLAANATTTATSQGVNHDDTAGLQAYFNANFSAPLPVGRFFVSSQINVPAYVQITGAAQYQTVITGVQIDNYIFNLTYGDSLSSVTFQTPTRTAATVVNTANSVNISNITCQGGSTGGHESTCFVGYSADSINLTNLYLEGWAGITSGQTTGGGPPEINFKTGVNDNLSNVTVFNTSNTPIPNQWVVLFDSCFNCTIVNGDFNNNQTYDSSNTDGVRMTNGSQADILTGNQILAYSDGVRMDSQTSGGLLTLDMEGNHLDFCVEACVLLNQGSWVTIVGNSFAGEGTTINNNYGIYFGSAFVNGPNTIVGNTMDGFNGGSAASISLVASLASTVISDNVFTHANLPAITNASALGAGAVLHDNPGYNPVGVTSATYSPATTAAYTAGASPETHYLTGGTVTAVKVPATTGASICTTTPCTVALGPGETFSVTYSAAPTDTKSVH